MFQTQSDIRRLLASSGLAPRKRFGQHFLVDRNLMQQLVDAAELDRDDVALEVGPGTGSLTGLLAERAGLVLAVEIDEAIAAVARGATAGLPNVRWLLTDALESKSRLSPRLLSEVLEATAGGRRLKLVANLPYDIATPLVLNLVQGASPWSRMCFTVQREVGDRLLAECGESAYGLASVLVAVLADARRIARVPRQAFWPSPRVESVMLRLDPPPPSRPRPIDPVAFGHFLRAFFQQRRKTIARIAANHAASTAVIGAMATMQLDGKLRPENVSPDTWLRLFDAVAASAGRC